MSAQVHRKGSFLFFPWAHMIKQFKIYKSKLYYKQGYQNSRQEEASKCSTAIELQTLLMRIQAATTRGKRLVKKKQKKTYICRIDS